MPLQLGDTGIVPFASQVKGFVVCKRGKENLGTRKIRVFFALGMRVIGSHHARVGWG